ncbi:MAG TPA: hypothetical protein VNA68_02100 [Candidatus Dormibacteraeota bacterium]|nr:hypothetical protein [Candidatus Dormibacteraeota bacterium]
MTELGERSFVCGLLCGIRLRGVTRMSYTDQWFSECAHAAFKKLKKAARAEAIEINFNIRPHFIHGDSQVAIRGIHANQAIAPFEAPYFDGFNLTISESDAHRLLEELPGSLEMWEKVTQAFLETYAPQRYAPIRT